MARARRQHGRLIPTAGVLALATLVAAWLAVTASFSDVARLDTVEAPGTADAIADTNADTVETTRREPATDTIDATSIVARDQSADATTPSTTTEPAAVTEPRSVRIAATGDLLIHGPVRNAVATGPGTYDFRPAFDLVAPQLRDADLAICHLETPIAADNRNVSSYPSFNVPTELAAAIAHAGFDTCSTASNHSLDAGVDGVVNTLDILDDAGVGHTGTARSAAEASEPVIHEVNEVRIGHGSYSYWFNGYRRPDDKPWLANPIDVDIMIADSRRLRDEGAEIVVLSIHWGLEYQVEPTAEQLEIAERLTAEPSVDLIIGHHAHVVQPARMINDKLVLFGLGNFLSAQSERCCGMRSEEGVIVEIDFTERSDGTMTFETMSATPTWVDRSNYSIIPGPAPAGSTDRVADRLEQAVARVMETLDLSDLEKNPR